MKPTIGCIVIYHCNRQEDASSGAEEFPAIVWRVQNSGCLDLCVFGMWGHTVYRLNVPEKSKEHPLCHWHWPDKVE
jgi:hypothetical protein